MINMLERAFTLFMCSSGHLCDQHASGDIHVIEMLQWIGEVLQIVCAIPSESSALIPENLSMDVLVVPCQRVCIRYFGFGIAFHFRCVSASYLRFHRVKIGGIMGQADFTT